MAEGQLNSVIRYPRKIVKPVSETGLAEGDAPKPPTKQSVLLNYRANQES